MGLDVMSAIRSRQAGFPVYAQPPDPTLGGLTPGIYPGTVIDPARGGANRLGSVSAAGGNGGTTALVILGVVVLALVGFNVSTRAFQA